MQTTTLSLAPMMEYTDRHFRKLIRLISSNTLLYTEMVAANALAHERADSKANYRMQHTAASEEQVVANYEDSYLRRFLAQSGIHVPPGEGASVLQLGGSDPQQLYQAAQTVAEMSQRGHCDYTALNLNCGCPSPKVAGKGCFGAALMDDPGLVAQLTTALHEGSQGKLPITVKCRIGTDSEQAFNKAAYAEVDEGAEYAKLCRFIEEVAAPGIVTDFSVHARIAVLQRKFSPADNRKIPPLKYNYIRRLCEDYPEFTFSLNGGIESLSQVQRELELCPKLKGVMVGRAWAADPWSFSMSDSLLYGKDDDYEFGNRFEILKAYCKHADDEEERGDPARIRRFITKAITPLFAGEPNGKKYRIALDEIAGIPKKLKAQAKSLAGQPKISELIMNCALDSLSDDVLFRSRKDSFEMLQEQERAKSQKDPRPNNGERSAVVTEWQQRRKAESDGLYEQMLSNGLVTAKQEAPTNQHAQIRNLTTAGTGGLSHNYRVFLGVGSNLGDRFQNVRKGIQLLCRSDEVRMLRSSFFHETAPMYLSEQPSFLNAAIEVETSLEPHVLLKLLKDVEQDLGRNFSEVRNGPRPLDLDVLFCDRFENGAWKHLEIDSSELQIPHPGIAEREFVLKPLSEVSGGEYMHPLLNQTVQQMNEQLPKSTGPSAVRVLPLPRNRTILFNETIVMGILNVTPDSFSDGGNWDKSVAVAVEHALQMQRDGASIIDIGGESTRPGAKEVEEEEQIRRTVPVIKAIREESDIPISIDTRHARVTRAAVEAGADIVNDVSGGLHDDRMLETVAEMGVPIVLMHMRGTPETMLSMTEYTNVVDDVTQSLKERVKAAEEAGIPRWLQIADPGIGFAKDMTGNLLLLKNLDKIRSHLHDIPIMVGTSRKGFLGKLTGVTEASERDFATVGSMIAPLCLEGKDHTCSILRVHNVAATVHATRVLDAIKSV